MSRLSKFRGSLVGAVIGDCLGGIHDTTSSVMTFADVASKADPLSLPSKLIRAGDRHIFRYSSDSLSLLTTARVLQDRRSKSQAELVESFQTEWLKALSLRQGIKKSASTSVLISDLQESISEFNASKYNLQGNCSLVRAIPCGLVDPSLAVALSSATHTHELSASASVIGAGLVNRFLLGEKHEKIPSDSHNHYIVSKLQRAESLANEVQEDEEETTIAQEKFASRIGTNSSSYVALASGYFGFVKALNHQQRGTADLQKLQDMLPKHFTHLSPSERSANLSGNSNRLDSSKALDRESAVIVHDDCPIGVAINWAISLGGDTRTNACIAGGLAGAYWGDATIPEVWKVFCEGVPEAEKIAHQLFESIEA